jgi:1,4-dihydroxy-6-naphthoate synthase
MSDSKFLVEIAHSPDSDDAFMFYALAKELVSSEVVDFKHILSDIQSLNVAAHEGRYTMTAISYHAYPYVADKYILTSAGSSVGDGYGPIIVAKENLDPKDLKGKRIAVPGLLTTAYLTLRLYEPDFEPVVVEFDQVMDTVSRGDADAGLIIHEGQLTWGDSELHNILDLGVWWKEQHGLPLALGANCILRDLPEEVKRESRRCLSESIQYALDHRPEALDYALQFGRGLARDDADKFVGMYVNHFTTEMRPEVLESAQIMLDLGHKGGWIPERVALEVV